MRMLKIFKAYLIGDFQNVFTYPAMMAVWMFETFFMPFSILLVWLTVISDSSDPQTRQSLINYYLMLPAVANLTGAWHGTFFAKDIRTGELNKLLVKPTYPLMGSISNNLTEKIVKLVIITPMIILASLIYPPQYQLSFLSLILFLFSLLLSVVISFLLDTLIGFAGFWITQVYSLKNFIVTADLTFGGQLIPLFLFPPFIKQIAAVLPFRYLVAFPVELLTHSLTSQEILLGLVYQLTWCVAFFISCIYIWRKGLKTYGAYGS